jgi:hypothetical protein
MKEELIWKFIDGYCSNEELVTVKEKLGSDPEWIEMYNKSVVINQELESSSRLLMSNDFKNKLLIQGLEVIEDQKEFSVLPLKLIILLVVLFVISVVVALNSTGGSSLIVFPKLDPQIMNMATWVTIGFLCLLGLDQVLKNIGTIKRNLNFVL